MSLLRCLCPLLLILAIGAGHVWALRPGHEWGDDFALYLLHARNLVEGQPYAATGYLYNPHYSSIGPPTYPPAAPALLAPLYAHWGLNLEAMKLAMVASFVVFLMLAYLLFRTTLGPAPAMLAIAVLGVNWFSFQETNTIGSDEFFLAFLYLTLLLFHRADAAAESSHAHWLLTLGGSLAGYLAFATRSLGALVFVAVMGQELLVHRRIRRPVLAALVLFAALALAQTLLVHSDRHYLDQFRGGAGVLVQHAGWYAERAAAFWSNGHWLLPATMLAGMSLVLALLGFVAQLRQRVQVEAVFAPLYLGVILLWPSYEAERYLYPLMPLWVFYTFCGLEHAWFLWRPALHRTVVALFLAAATLSYAGRYTTLDWGPLPHGVATPAAQQMFQYVSDHTPPDAVVVFAKPRAMTLFTRRRSAAPHVPERDEQLLDYLRGIRASYLVVVNSDDTLGRAANPRLVHFLHAFVARHERVFHPVWTNEEFAVYERMKDEEGLATPSRGVLLSPNP